MGNVYLILMHACFTAGTPFVDRSLSSPIFSIQVHVYMYNVAIL